MENQTLDHQPQAKTMTATINVLSILTFIGCGLFLISAAWQYYASFQFSDQMVLMQEQLYKIEETGNDTAYNLTLQALENSKLKYENNHLLLATSIIGIGLCLWGALSMRKMKLNGYYLWLVGEITPILINIAIVGFNMVGAIEFVLSIITAGIFIVLYSLQVKHLS